VIWEYKLDAQREEAKEVAVSGVSGDQTDLSWAWAVAGVSGDQTDLSCTWLESGVSGDQTDFGSLAADPASVGTLVLEYEDVALKAPSAVRDTAVCGL
jgi:hypothetical protein